MEHLLSVWPQIAGQLDAARRIFLFFDYDGTLTPIVKRPELAAFPPNNRRLLGVLASEKKVIVGVISGRTITDLKTLMKVNQIIYAGNHGLEIEGHGINYRYPLGEDIKVPFGMLIKVLEKGLSDIPGVIIEDKGMTVSIHYRLVDKTRVEDVKEIFKRSVGGLQAAGKVRITTGKKVLEVRPAVDWNKGKAVQLLMKRIGKSDKSGIVPVYLGDDITDEDAFAQINRYNSGITVFVGKHYQASSACYYLRSSGEVTKFLEQVTELLGREQDDTVC